MLHDDRNFLTRERQDRLLCEAAAQRLARLHPHGPRRSLRERTAGVLIALALRIAPSVGSVPQGTLAAHG